MALTNRTPRFDIHEDRDYHMDNAGLDRGGESKRNTNFNRKNTNIQNQTIGYLGNTKKKRSYITVVRRKS